MYDKRSMFVKFGSVQFGIAAAMSAASLVTLSACEERPYQAPNHSAPPVARPPADLMGAPSPYTAPPVMQPPAYAPPVYSQPAYAPPAESQPAYAPAPAYSQQPYDTGSVVAMAPIPNPGDPGAGAYYDGHVHGGRVHSHYEGSAPALVAENTVTSPYGEGHPAPGRHPSYAYTAPAPTPVAPVYTPKPTPPVYAKAPPAYTPPVAKPVYSPPKTYAKTTTTTSKTTTYAATKVPPAVTYDAKKVGVAAGSAAAVLAMNAKHAAVDAKYAAKTAVQTYKAKTGMPTSTPTPVSTGDRATNLASLQTTLTDAVGKTAILTAPASFTANQPSDVTLTIPAGFGDTLRNTAQKDGLGDAAASVNMTAILSGDGFSVTPDDTQSVPLALGQPTKFVWTVTAQAGAKGPLHADVGADLLGGGSDKLALGSVQKSAGMGIKLTPKVIGASLLVLIAALVVAWLARGRGPTRSVAARRASRRAARGGRPLDMGTGSVEDTTAV